MCTSCSTSLRTMTDLLKQLIAIVKAAKIQKPERTIFRRCESIPFYFLFSHFGYLTGGECPTIMLLVAPAAILKLLYLHSLPVVTPHIKSVFQIRMSKRNVQTTKDTGRPKRQRVEEKNVDNSIRPRFWLLKSEPDEFSIEDLACSPNSTGFWDVGFCFLLSSSCCFIKYSRFLLSGSSKFSSTQLSEANGAGRSNFFLPQESICLLQQDACIVEDLFGSDSLNVCAVVVKFPALWV